MKTRVLILMGIWLLFQGPGLATALDDDDPAFRWSPDKRIISQQIEAALPAAEKGMRLLQAASTETQITAAIQSIFDSYRYLRAAEESGRNIEGQAKIKDPLAKIRYDHIANIRLRLRWCRDNREHLLAQETEYTTRCLDGLSEAVRELKVVVASLL